MRHAARPVTGTGGHVGTDRTRHAPRADIQGLRALAVALVVVYHVGPDLLPGGFVGVDVFFVISGYLIIGSLAREVERTGTVDLVGFYVRRIRRLVPAATVVVVACVVLSFVLLAPSQLRRNLGDALASTLQVANWRFALGPDEYAQATASVSPFQHFWSLAVEEQFYVAVPLALLGAAWFARTRGRSVGRCVLVTLTVLAAASLGWSVVQTVVDPGMAYFSTLTRMWELVLGGLAAILVRRRALGPALSGWVGGLGLVLVVGSAVALSTSMPFPGSLALVPVAGTVMLLVAGAHGRGGVVTSLLSRRPLTWTGDISYSLYLWHWPMVVGALALSGPTLGAVDGPLVIVASVLAAVVSERVVERPFRTSNISAGRAVERRRRRVLLAGASATAAVAAMTAVSLGVVNAQVADVADSVDGSHPGAAALVGVPVPSGVAVSPDPRVAFEDVPLVFRDDCIATDLTLDSPDRPEDTCTYGARTAPDQVALVGDSHAPVLSTPLAELAGAEGFGLTVHVRNGCPFTVIPPAGLSDCADHNLRTIDALVEDRPDLVVITSMTPSGYGDALGWFWDNESQIVEGYEQMLDRLLDAGLDVVVVRDTPYAPFSAPDCVARGGTCAFERAIVLDQVDALVTAATGRPEVTVVDLTDHLCGVDVCESVVGNVLVYRDNHLTDTYADTLESALWGGLGPVLAH